MNMKNVIAFLLQSLVLYLGIKAYSRLNGNKTEDNDKRMKEKSGNDSLSNSNSTTGNSSYEYKVEQLNCLALGKHTWAVLHSIAASYPNNPNETEKNSFKELFDNFVKRYPCSTKSFQEIYTNLPLGHSSREELVYYICELHNIVNKKISKEQFNCRHAFDIWGGDCGCDS